MDLEAFNARQQKIAKPRVQRIARLRAAGKTLQAIATLLGISRERVRQIETREKRRSKK